MKKISNILMLGTLLASMSMSAVIAEGNHKGGHGKADTGVHEHGVGAHWMSPKEASSRVNPVKPDDASIIRGKETYANYCASCHGASAKGDGPAAGSLKPKPTNLKAMSGGLPDGDFAWKIANGRGAMPGWQGVLNENQIWDLVNFIQDLKDDDKDKGHADQDHKKHDHKNKKKHTH